MMNSGIDVSLFREEYRKYLASLREIVDFPYMKLTEEEYERLVQRSTHPGWSPGMP